MLHQIITALPVAALLLSSPCVPLLADETDDCLACHSDPDLSTERAGRAIPLHVDRSLLSGSVHPDHTCTDCHAGLDAGEIPHARVYRPVDCSGCHGDLSEVHIFHGPVADGGDGATTCTDCHGTHGIHHMGDPGTALRPDRLRETCGSCHDTVVEQFIASQHGRSLAEGVVGAPNCVDCHRRPITDFRGGGVVAEHKLLDEKLCLSCHLDDPEVRARMTPEAGFISAYEGSVHGRALLEGNAAAANCVDCHGSHEMKKGFEPTSRVNKRRIPGTCGTCHTEISEVYAASVHGAALEKGSVETPVCTDCHGEHGILEHLDPRSPIAPANISEQVCSPCHSSIRLSEKYGIASDRFQTFSDSYHGLAIRGGGVEVANCASCHGSHDIRPSTDPKSSIYATSLAATCGRCHPGANARFAVGNVHLVMNGSEEPILYWVGTAYVMLIVLTIGGMLVHNGLDFARRARRRLRIRHGLEYEEPPGKTRYLRMTVGERVQHLLLMLSFVVLVITGFMLHYPDAWWVAGLRRISDNLFDLRNKMHRIAAVIMVLASLWHIGYLTISRRGRGFLRDMMPRRNDLTDVTGTLMYYVGLRVEKPRFGRFSYVEKAEYWALVWGTMVMTVTGIILWFENTFIGLLTKLGWDISRTVHFYEAWLAMLAILVWHIYYVVFNPDAYPMNTAWITGTISEEEMAEEHPLELEALRRHQMEDMMNTGESPVEKPRT